MRTNIIKSILFFVVLFLGSCSSDLRMPDVQLAALPKITFDTTSEKLIQDGIPYTGKIVVDSYYKDLPTDAKVVVAMNGNYASTAIKTFKTGVTTFPTTYTVTGAELATLFGKSAILIGDYFEFGLDVQMKDGKWYPAFNPLGVAYGSGPTNLPGSSPILKLPAVCALYIDTFVGTATISDDYWYGGVYTTTIEKVDATHLKFKNFAELGGDFVMTIDPSTRLITVPKQIYAANLADWGLPSYTNAAIVGKGDIDACLHKITLNLTPSVDQGGWSLFKLVITY